MQAALERDLSISDELLTIVNRAKAAGRDELTDAEDRRVNELLDLLAQEATQ